MYLFYNKITSTSVSLVKANLDSNSCRQVAVWNVPAGELISVATSTHSECLIACRNQLFYIVIENENLNLIK